MSAFEIYREIIRDNLEYAIMVERYKYDKDRIDEIVDLMLKTVCTAKKTLRIAGDDYPAELVKSKFLKLHSSKTSNWCFYFTPVGGLHKIRDGLAELFLGL